MKAAIAAAVLAVAPAGAQEFAAASTEAAALVREGHAWRTSHRDGLLQRLNAALAHLTAESKPSVVMLATEHGSGSGFIVDAAGLIVTNAHVAGDVGYQGTLAVILPDGRRAAGRVVALGDAGAQGNPLDGHDLALVKLEKALPGLAAVKLGDSSKLREGHLVAAMGYPLGQPFTATQGSVSGMDARTGVKVSFVQTDAAINPGNSGGPLFSMDGAVVGVNTWIVSRSGGSDGIGYAIRVEAVKAFLERYRGSGPFDESAATAAACPPAGSLSRPWEERSGPRPDAELQRHLAAGLDAAVPALVPVSGVSWWVGASRRGRGGEPAEPSCFGAGSAAFYVLGPEDAPALDFAAAVRGGAEPRLAERLVELRWYDASAGRKVRWFDEALARRLGWHGDGRGAPAAARPLPLPQAPNELL